MSLLIILASACLAWCYPLQTFISALVAFLIWPSNPKPLFGIYNQPGKMHNSIIEVNRHLVIIGRVELEEFPFPIKGPLG